MKLMNGKTIKPIYITGRLIIIGELMILMLIAGCAQAASPSSENDSPYQRSLKRKAPVQLIIQFRHHDFDPSNPVFVEKLSRDAQAILEYLRPMSGGAHVFRIKTISDPKQLDAIIKRLSARPDILYVEKDNIVGHTLQKKQD
jgi:hypothetical protein